MVTTLTGIVLPAREATLADRIAAGQYNFFNGADFTEQHFPLTLPAGPRELAIVHFGRVVDRNEVENWAAENGYEVALIDDLLAVSSHPNYNGFRPEYYIMALGSSVILEDGYRWVPVLIKGSLGHDLQLQRRDDDFHEFSLFLVVRKTERVEYKKARVAILGATEAVDHEHSHGSPPPAPFKDLSGKVESRICEQAGDLEAQSQSDVSSAKGAEDGVAKPQSQVSLASDSSKQASEDEAAKSEMRTPMSAAPPAAVTNSIGMELVLIPPGAFVMGSPGSEEGGGFDELPHLVRITKPFYMGKYEVTRAQYKQVMGELPRHSTDDTPDDFPVDGVRPADAAAFCKKLGEHEGKTYRLPTEAEWEYACRAGTSTPFHFGWVCDGRQANCDGKGPYGTATPGPYLHRLTRVGSYPPNAFGLYDMHGNVSEWCLDCYDYDEDSPRNDPQITFGLIARGGKYSDSLTDCRSAKRKRWSLGWEGDGFRVVFIADAGQAESVPARNFVPTGWQPPKKKSSFGRACLGLFLGMSLWMVAAGAAASLVDSFLELPALVALALSFIPPILGLVGEWIIVWGLMNRRKSSWLIVNGLLVTLLLVVGSVPRKYFGLWSGPIDFWQGVLLVWIAWVLVIFVGNAWGSGVKYDARTGKVVQRNDHYRANGSVLPPIDKGIFEKLSQWCFGRDLDALEHKLKVIRRRRPVS